MTRDRYLERQVEKIQAENKVLRELVDGVQELVEIFPSTFPAQIAWKAEWLRKAKEILHGMERRVGK